ncbi:Trk system potassium transporter TrkA [Eubacterium xylanophilum]|uniref:Trk system potassium transporter TrkA n=1 Tax=Eubacterium xylanophilum TaxID=39497 RepID=UPI000478C7E6|nr:Trk system potassium transporter TrkA [Eubacterium xylanophilum]
MKIIIVGCGKVGATLAEGLYNEGNDITIIDKKYGIVEELSNKYDVMGIAGNGACIATQTDAGIDKADLLIAVTGSDELNLLCCIVAKRVGNCKTIARVRNPEYISEADFVKESLGLAMTINPELATAAEISKVLRYPSAMKVDTFAKGRVEMLKLKITENCPLAGMRVSDMEHSLKVDILVCAVHRDGEIFIPRGDFELQADDIISFMATKGKASEFFKKIGFESHKVKDTMIVGGGDVAYYLAKDLINSGINVKLIEKDEKRCDFLSESISKAQIINADGSDQVVLIEEGIEKAESFVTLTNLDEENIVLSMYARSTGANNKKIVTKINRDNYDGLIKELNIDTVIYPKQVTADKIMRFVRAMRNSKGTNVETMYSLFNGKAEALEFVVKEKSSFTNIPLMNMSIDENTLVACIVRKREVIIPRGFHMLQPGDSVVVVTKKLGISDIEEVIHEKAK